MEWCWISLIIRYEEIKTTMTYHLISLRRAVTNQITKLNVADDGEVMEKLENFHTIAEDVKQFSNMENAKKIPQN